MKSSILKFIYIINIFNLSVFAQNKNQIAMQNTWPKGITYEIFVMAFADSNGDKIGDINGMTSKLDYLSDLGIEAIWLMPISPSPTYHKYDIIDYYGIDPQYGTMADFKKFVAQAHQKNIKVIIDVVVNHTSSQHPWFLSAKSDKNSPYRDYYVWSADTNLIKKEPNAWHKVPNQKERYYGIFWGEMPDLNYDNPKVREEVKKIGRFWLLEVGVDGFRLDAARHIYPDDEQEKSHAWWVEFRKAMQEVKKDVYLVGEVTMSDSLVAPYFKGLHANFNFDLAENILKAVKNGRDTAIVKKLVKSYQLFSKESPNFIDATFLSNHDQNRYASELKADVEKIKLAVSILFTLPGSPYLYYGEEIGMLGVKPDEQIREPFLWTPNQNDKMNTAWRMPINSTADSVKALSMQIADPNSIFHHYKKWINTRRTSEALTLGTLEEVKNSNKNILVFNRLYNGEKLMVIHNLSGKPQDLAFLSPKSKIIYGTLSNDILSPYSSVIFKLNK